MTSRDQAALRIRAVRAAVVRQLVVGKDRTGNDIGSHATLYVCARPREPSRWSVASRAASSGFFPRSRATM
jgi:hypothetical protein